MIFGWLKRTEKKAPVAPEKRKRSRRPLPNSDDMRRDAVKEAIDSLGLLKPEALETIYGFLQGDVVDHPRETCASYRKTGEQLSAQEKKAIGLRSNAFLSRKAFADLTAKGLEKPLEAHEKVFLRAFFTMTRYSAVVSGQSLQGDGFEDEYKYDVLNMDCPVCSALDGKIVKEAEVHIFPLPKCVCDTANFGVRPHIDFIKAFKDSQRKN